MIPRSAVAAIGAALTLLGPGVARAQRGGGDWMTSAFDAQRSSWVRSDAKISPDSLRKPGFELSWKMKLAPGAVMPPALLDFYIGYRGFRALGFFGAAADRVVAVDTELARLEWDKPLAAAAPTPGTPACPGGMTSAVARPTSTAYPPVPTGRGAGRGSPAKSAVGAPHEGAVILSSAPRQAPFPPRPPRPAAAKPGSPEAAVNPFAPRVQWVHALSADGKLHAFWVSNGNEPKPPVAFVPPGANALGLVSYGDTDYVATTGRCGGAGSGVWALDLPTGKVNHWTAPADVAGSAGPAAGLDGTLYVAAGPELTALAAHTLTPLASYRTSGAAFTSSPVVFEFKGKDLVAAATGDGRLHLLDAAALGAGVLESSAPFPAPAAAGSIASWQDPAGTRWVLAAARAAIVAWKVIEKDGKPAFEPAWTSRDLIAPLPPIVVSGVVFAASGGDRSSNAVLYALDAFTGQELWNSGATISSFVRDGGLAAGGSRIYIATADGTQYAFGFPIEH